MEGKTGVRAWKAARAAGRKEEGMAGGLEGKKGGRTEGEGKAGWVLGEDGAEKGPRQRRDRVGGGRVLCGAQRCTGAAAGGVRPYLAGTC